MYLMLLLSIVLSLLHVCSPTAHCISSNSKDKDADIPDKEKDYDVRPNIFITRNHLLGRFKGEGDEHKKIFTYSAGPYGPYHWNKLFPKCAGKRQSPINIDLVNLKRITYPKLIWSQEYEKLPYEMTIANNGHTIMLKAKYDHEYVPKLEGGPLMRPYSLQQIHFHWSSSDHRGSEHTINKKTFPMEMHVVHYRSELNKTTAAGVEKGLCVVGYIFEIGDKCNEALMDILAVSDQLKMDRYMPIELTNKFRLDNLLDKFDKEYVTYYGSLTVPPCYESVIWLISPYTLTVSRKQLAQFRGISMSSKGFGDNYRALQTTNGRPVHFVN